MPNFRKISEFETAILKNKLKITKKKKTIPYISTIIVLAYIIIFNLRENFSNLFGNQLDFIEIISYFFAGVLLTYFIYIFFRISVLFRQSKEWSLSQYKLTKLEEQNK